MALTDAVKQAVSEQLDTLRPVLDGACRPCGVKIAVWLLPDGTIREIETAPAYKVSAGKRA